MAACVVLFYTTGSCFPSELVLLHEFHVIAVALSKMLMCCAGGLMVQAVVTEELNSRITHWSFSSDGTMMAYSTNVWVISFRHLPELTRLADFRPEQRSLFIVSFDWQAGTEHLCGIYQDHVDGGLHVCRVKWPETRVVASYRLPLLLPTANWRCHWSDSGLQVLLGPPHSSPEHFYFIDTESQNTTQLLHPSVHASPYELGELLCASWGWAGCVVAVTHASCDMLFYDAKTGMPLAATHAGGVDGLWPNSWHAPGSRWRPSFLHGQHRLHGWFPDGKSFLLPTQTWVGESGREGHNQPEGYLAVQKLSLSDGKCEMLCDRVAAIKRPSARGSNMARVRVELLTLAPDARKAAMFWLQGEAEATSQRRAALVNLVCGDAAPLDGFQDLCTSFCCEWSPCSRWLACLHNPLASKVVLRVYDTETVLVQPLHMPQPSRGSSCLHAALVRALPHVDEYDGEYHPEGVDRLHLYWSSGVSHLTVVGSRAHGLYGRNMYVCVTLSLA